MLFSEFKKLIAIDSRIHLNNKDTMEYINYWSPRELPDTFDNLHVYGVGMVDSEFYTADGVLPDKSGTHLAYLSALEVVVSKEERRFGRIK